MLALAAAALAGCGVKSRPSVAVEPVTLTRWDAAMFSEQAFDPRWWRQLEDPVLDELQALALSANRDVATAVARLDQARAVFDETHRERLPTVTVGAAVDVREQAQPGFLDEPTRTTTYRAGFDAFVGAGPVRPGALGDPARPGQRREPRRRARQTSGSAWQPTSDGTTSSCAALQQQIGVLERSLVNQRETLRLTTVRRDAGIGEEQDVASATARVSALEAEMPPLRIVLASREHRLAVLTGTRPGHLAVNLAPRTYPPLAKSLPLGDAAELLNRRPDVRAAERRLAATAAREGVAAADLYPRITLSGVLGLLAGRGNLFGRADSRAWAITPALQWTAFDVGSARARLRGARAVTREVLADYEQTMLLALEETEKALVAYREQQERLVKLGDQARESARAAGIARARYREGVADFLTLLDAERTQLQAEDGVARAEAGVFISLVGLYRAVGGIVEVPQAPAAGGLRP